MVRSPGRLLRTGDRAEVRSMLLQLRVSLQQPGMAVRQVRVQEEVAVWSPLIALRRFAVIQRGQL